MTSPVGLKLEHASEPPGGLVKRQIAGPHPRVGICISSKFPDAADVAGSGTTHLEPPTSSKLLILQTRNWSTEKGGACQRSHAMIMVNLGLDLSPFSSCYTM